MPTTDTGLDHHEYQELLGAYALDALEPDERRAIEEHLRTCSTCRAELRQLRLAAGELALLAAEIEPPAGLRGRIHEAALREARGDEPEQPLPLPLQPRPEPRRPERGWSRRARTWSPWLAAAVLLVAALGLLVWNLQLRGEPSGPAVETIALQAQGGAAVSGELIYLPDRQIGVLKTESLPPLQPGQVYQMWLIQDGTPLDAGVFTTPAGEVALSLDRAQFQAFALTREPGPDGSPAPTSDPFAIAPLGGS